ncbi:hypothetical protein BDU57DRAFT_508697 [Ampelomyces quisqualis]|uniref:Uncharacterized protein n=1 Tax=Ampelomyces quisqualis TaxID=50730 RepID=A0A6A5QXB3_AMPQU|nr:hypothetical protein BDU57DRAFT_508697 [Ampelomyces quisqualis]
MQWLPAHVDCWVGMRLLLGRWLAGGKIGCTTTGPGAGDREGGVWEKCVLVLVGAASCICLVDIYGSVWVFLEFKLQIASGP